MARRRTEEDSKKDVERVLNWMAKHPTIGVQQGKNFKVYYLLKEKDERFKGNNKPSYDDIKNFIKSKTRRGPGLKDTYDGEVNFGKEF